MDKVGENARRAADLVGVGWPEPSAQVQAELGDLRRAVSTATARRWWRATRGLREEVVGR
jgi:hypothetical protein